MESKPFYIRNSKVIDPHSDVMVAWMLVVFGVTIYTGLATPIEVAFIGADVTSWFFILNRVVDLLFICDMVLIFRTAYVDEYSGRLITDPPTIVRNCTCGPTPRHATPRRAAPRRICVRPARRLAPPRSRVRFVSSCSFVSSRSFPISFFFALLASPSARSSVRAVSRRSAGRSRVQT